MITILGTEYGGVSSKQESGQMIWAWGDGPVQECSTLMCAHCQFQIQIHIGSHTERSWCLRCNGPTCGKQRCEEYCEPFERGLERLEGRYSLAAKMDLLVTGESPWE